MLDRAGKGKQNGGKAGETKCRRADWVAWLERVSPSSMMWVRRTHGYQRREAESGSGGAQCSPIQLWVSRKEAGTFTKKNKKQKNKEWKAALWEKHGESRVAEQPEWALPHAPKSLTLIPECWLWLQRATQIWCLLQKNNKKKTKHKTRGAGASVSITALHERDDPVHGLVCFWRGRDILYCSQVCDLPNNG